MTLGLEPMHNPIDEGIELLTPVVNVVPIVQMGVDGHELIRSSAGMTGYAERYTGGLADKRQEDTQFELGLGPALSRPVVCKPLCVRPEVADKRLVAAGYGVDDLSPIVGDIASDLHPFHYILAVDESEPLTQSRLTGKHAGQV